MSGGGFLPGDLERTPIPATDEPVVQVAPVRPPLTPGEWVRRNLFSSWFNGVLTIVSAILVLLLGLRIVRFVFVSADWSVLRANVRVYMVGRFPEEELWRVWAVAFFLALLVGISRGVLLPPSRTRRGSYLRGVMAVAAAGALVYLVDSLLVWLLLGIAVALYAGGVAAARKLGPRLIRPVLVA